MIYLDFETRSEADLTKVGAVAYAQHPSTEVIVACYAQDDGPVHVWLPGDPTPLLKGFCIEAHNVSFEWSIWNYVCVPKYGWPRIEEHNWRDTLALACYYSLPPSLDKLAKALGLGEKDPAGQRLISKYCKLHLKTSKREIPEEDLLSFIEYCKQDVELERAISKRLGPLPVAEQRVFQMDQAINRRGLFLDLDGIAVATKLVKERYNQQVQKFFSMTGLRPSQGEKLKGWLEDKGYPLPDLQRATVEEALEDPSMPLEIEDVLRLRLATSAASTKKLDAMSRMVSSNGRALYQTRYHGALTGRWTGAGFQPLNLKRGYEGVDPERLVQDIKRDDLDWLDCVYGSAVDAIANASRHWIMAEEGNELVVGDFTSIEAIVLAYLAGEEWKLDAFWNKDPIYEIMGAKVHGIPREEAFNDFKKNYPAERQDGKTGELAFGYQGGLGAWRKFDSTDRHTDEEVIEICRNWRYEHPNIVYLWDRLESAALTAARSRQYESVHKNDWRGGDVDIELGFEIVGDWLTMVLPNGKKIWYYKPEIRSAMPVWHKPDENDDCGKGVCKCFPRDQLTYMSWKEGRWVRVYTYGGKLAENATQAFSREVLVNAMRAVESEWPGSIILTVYDEIVCEAPKGVVDLKKFKGLLERPPAYATDMPLMAECWVGPRYKK